MPVLQPQSISQKKGEVAFRAFHKQGVDLASLEYLQTCYRERRGIFRDLTMSGISLSPFLDLGAENGPISLTLCNDLEADGIALDISRDALAAMPLYAEKMGLSRLPLRVRADAHSLPLRNGCLPFAIAWGALHHFPDPRPVLAELRRVLQPGGMFLVDGEPVRRRLSLNLGRTRSLFHLSWWQKHLLRLHVLPWFVTIDGREAEDAGAAEMQFSRETYKRMLVDSFEKVMMTDSPYITALIRSAGPLGRLLLSVLGPNLAPKAEVSLFGGAVGARCWKDPEQAAAFLTPNGPLPLDHAPVTGMRTLMLRKKIGHTRLLLIANAPVEQGAAFSLRVTIDDEIVIGNWLDSQTLAVELPSASHSRSSIRLTLDSGKSPFLFRHFVLRDTSDRNISWISADLPPSPAQSAVDALACPACWIVSPRCRADLCGAPCLAADAGAIRIENNRARLLQAPNARAVAACPVGAIDHPALVKQQVGEQTLFRCLVCDAKYPLENGILDLLPPALKRELA